MDMPRAEGVADWGEDALSARLDGMGVAKQKHREEEVRGRHLTNRASNSR